MGLPPCARPVGRTRRRGSHGGPGAGAGRLSGRRGGRLLDLGLWALASGWRFDVLGREHLAGIRPHGAPAIWVMWHAHFLPLLWLHRHDGTTLLISRHRDGERFARVASRLGYRTLRGSSTRGGASALLGLVRCLQGGAQVAIAADGPRGPREQVKLGAVAAALRTGAPIIPVGVSARPAWRLRSWDRFLLPAPWACVRVAYGAPLRFTPAERNDRDQAARRLQDGLDQVSCLAAS